MYWLVLGLQMPPSEFRPTGPRLEVTVTNRGKFEITTSQKTSPQTVQHIVRLVRKGFYQRQRFHRVESWVTQWGAPRSRDLPLGDARVTGGGSGTSIPFEESTVDFLRGVVGIASTGLQVGGDSQIFILKSDTMRLFRSYAVLGKVTSGMSVVDKVQRGDRIARIRVLSPAGGR